MNTGIVTLSRPNMVAMKGSRITIRSYVNIRLSNIKNSTIVGDLKALDSYREDVDQRGNDTLRKMIDLSDSSSVVNALSYLTRVDRNADPGAFSAFEQNLNSVLTDKQNDLLQWRNTLNTAVFNLRTMSLTDNTYKLTELENTIATLRQIAKKESDGSHYDEMLKRMATLESAIEAYESETFLDKAKPVIDEVVKTVGSVVDSPATYKATLVKEGATVVSLILNIANAAVKYDDMVTLRGQLAVKINTRELAADLTDRDIREHVHELEQLRSFEMLKGVKTEYVNEIQKVADSCTSFLDEVYSSTPSDAEGIATRFNLHAPLFQAYASDLFNQWLRV
ncbi:MULTISPECIES: alpha-xenorhabdolysin family binary toxin subunit B [Pseudomonas]|uniref:Alpha-xenorhabdolysin family binary toxin subunit B n=1 Tax=Pseudomonas azadiae TaxID=2843612 RepID=A0ABS6NY57_9PSED|nr:MULTISPECIES: alpha-xenorhabdolysin family binary toxin subunit B [Pseudomonas]MBV4453144.1 alpha-xenorhabdolysin family binary toxin subunit B [Pseudomonas azadiae]NMF41580.1 alpha-xenorhabdolysin family binary toxin subunit B [Pseudomonas sp. SWRI 103]